MCYFRNIHKSTDVLIRDHGWSSVFRGQHCAAPLFRVDSDRGNSSLAMF